MAEQRDIIGIPRNVFAARKNPKTMETYLDGSEGTCYFEVRYGDELLIRGDSFEKAHSPVRT